MGSAGAGERPPFSPLRSLTHTSSSCPADFGVEHAVSIENLGKAEISKQVEQLVQKGESMPRQVQMLRFECRGMQLIMWWPAVSHFP